MHFDDRLATVLRLGADGERASRTQFRQLIDLLGSAPADASDALMADDLILSHFAIGAAWKVHGAPAD